MTGTMDKTYSRISKKIPLILALSVVFHQTPSTAGFLVLPTPSKKSAVRGAQALHASSSVADNWHGVSTQVRSPQQNVYENPQPSVAAPLVRYKDARTASTMQEHYYHDAPLVQQSDQQSAWYEAPNNQVVSSRTVQGGSRSDPWYTNGHDRVNMALQTDGRPLDANVELWQGPNNTPHKMRLWSEDGMTRPFQANVDTSPRGASSWANSAMDIRNTGPMEFPLSASVAPARANVYDSSYHALPATRVQGGALETFSIHDPSSVSSVQVSLQTDGMPLNAVIELWQGPGQVKQIAEVYNDVGRPFSTVIETPPNCGGITIAVRNVGPMAYPLTARVEPIRGGYGGSPSRNSIQVY